MKVTVDLRNDCTPAWAPDKVLCKQWIRTALATAQLDQDIRVSISFVTEQASAELNEKYRGKAKATNVLSFPSEYPEHLTQALAFQPLGDIVICPALVAREAVAQGKALEAHWAHLTIHGMLHLIGYDHKLDQDAHTMEQLEVEALQALGITDPYSSGNSIDPRPRNAQSKTNDR